MKKLRALCLSAVLLCGLLAGCGQAAESQPLPEPAAPELPSAQPAFFLGQDVNPYTGLPKGENYPEGRRGVAVMINNVRAALPQSGINQADVLYEMVTESGITRMMALYRDYQHLPVVGPLRSARDQHVQLMLPLDCLYAHIGTSSYAAEMLESYRYLDSKAIDGRYKTYYWVDAERRRTLGQEHCVYMNGESFTQAVEKYKLDTASEPAPVFNFGRYDETPRVLEDGDAQSVSIRFSSYADSLFTYDQETGCYYKEEFGQPQIDANTKEQYSADNVLLLFADIDKYPDGLLSHVNFDAQGAGMYFCGGRYQKIRWMKGVPNMPLRIVDQEGTETDQIINPGRTYVAVVDIDQVEHCKVNDVSLAELNT